MEKKKQIAPQKSVHGSVNSFGHFFQFATRVRGLIQFGNEFKWTAKADRGFKETESSIGK